jgi:heat-inducible transcriptional repressor
MERHLPAEGISPRAEQILESIVRTHIESGEPVASGNLSGHGRHGFSAASIRNVMAELAERGYLSQAHASAGRIPTAKAYHHFVGGIGRGRVATAEVDRLRDMLLQSSTMEGRVQATSRLLTGLTHGIGIAAAIPASSLVVDHVELVPLASRKVLMVVITRDGLVRDQVVTLDEAMSPDELNSVRNFFEENYSGWTLMAIRTDLKRRLAAASNAYHQLLTRFATLYDRCLADTNLAPELYLDGAANLIEFELGATRERLGEIFRTLEEKQRIAQLLERFLEPPGEVLFQIGLGDENPTLEPLSLIGVSMRMPGGLTSRFAVIGPLRMDYERAISAVRHVSRAFQTAQDVH